MHTRTSPGFRESLVQSAPTQAIPEGVVFVMKDKITSKIFSVRLPDGREGYLFARDVGLVL